MKKTFLRIAGGFGLLGVQCMIWGMIIGVQTLTTLGVVNMLLAGAIIIPVGMKQRGVKIPHLSHYWKHYGWTILVMGRIRWMLTLMITGAGLYQVILWSVGGVVSIFITQHLYPLRRGDTTLSVWMIAGLLSLMTVLIVFGQYRSVQSPWMIVAALGVGRLIYTIVSSLDAKHRTLSPLYITWGLLTIIAAIRATTTTLIDAYEDRKIQTIVYETQEVYLPSQTCLPDRGNIQTVDISQS